MRSASSRRSGGRPPRRSHRCATGRTRSSSSPFELRARRARSCRCAAASGPTPSSIQAASRHRSSPPTPERSARSRRSPTPEALGGWIEELAALRPELELDPEGAMLSTWHDDPWVRGSYSARSLSSPLRDAELSDPDRTALLRRRAHGGRLARSHGGGASKRRARRRPAASRPASASGVPGSVVCLLADREGELDRAAVREHVPGAARGRSLEVAPAHAVVVAADRLRTARRTSGSARQSACSS